MREYFLGDGTVLYFDCDDDYMTLCVCQNSKKWMLKSMNLTAHKLYSVILTKKKEKEESNQYVLNVIKRPVS